MSLILYTFGSGLAFWIGVVLVLVGFYGRIKVQPGWRDRLAVYAVYFGLIFVALSAVPLPYAAYTALLVVTLLWLMTERSQRVYWQQRRSALRICFVTAWLVAIGWELPYQFSPSISAQGPIHVIGDSITAGVGERTTRWPRLLAEQRGLEVVSHARAGATTKEALEQAQAIGRDARTVIVEIGGNDLLGSTPTAEFARDLDQLLTSVTQNGRQVVMFELPLPPLSNEFGHVQREQAARHGVALIPKRVLMGILAPSDSTDDTIHLTQKGHQRLAAAVNAMIE